jgi:hypothetical protein
MFPKRLAQQTIWFQKIVKDCGTNTKAVVQELTTSSLLSAVICSYTNTSKNSVS